MVQTCIYPVEKKPRKIAHVLIHVERVIGLQ